MTRPTEEEISGGPVVNLRPARRGDHAYFNDFSVEWQIEEACP